MDNTDFTDLHVHSSFSLLDGTANPEKIAEETNKLGRKYLGISDHGSIDGWVEHTKACQKLKINPIYGIELYMLEDWDNRHKGRPKNLHLTAIAKTEQGQKKLIQACGYAHSEGLAKHGWAKRPFLPMDYPLKNGWAGDIIISTGCAGSPFWNAEKGIDLLADYYDAFKSDLYAEIMPITDWEPQKAVNKAAVEAADTFGIKPIVTCDVHYLSKDDCGFHQTVIGLGQGPSITIKTPTIAEGGRRWAFETHCSHIHTIEQLQNSLQQLGLDNSFILNTREIAEKTVHTLKSSPVILPSVIGKEGEEEIQEFVNLIINGLERLGLDNRDDYIARLDKEIKVIEERKFVRYFLMVWDVIKWAKENGVFIGPARGSVGGSLVAYCLGITNLDPIKYGLFFERFLAPGRFDYPDIDIDIDSRQRNLVEKYLKNKYGESNVAHVSTFGRMMGRSAIRDVSRFYEVPLFEADKMSKSIIHKYEGEEGTEETIKLTIESEDPVALEFAQKYPKVVEYAQKLEGLAKSYGVHASGYVISRDSLTNSDRCYLADRNGQSTVNWSGPDLEYMGFIKLDLLGLSTLSAIAECIELVKKNHDISLDMTKIPMDDKKTFDMIYKGETATLFHLSTAGYTKYCKELKPDNFRHMAAILALWKPGPIAAGMTEGYKNCKLGLQSPVYYSEGYRKITEETYGYVIYQEQIVQLLTELAGFSWMDADKIRKDISKKLGVDKIAAIEEPFVQGCLKNKTMDEDNARNLWRQLVFFGVYVFNKSHSIGYGMLAYWTAYLKAHYPVEWICAYLNFGSADKEDKKTGEKNIDVALREAKRLGITIKTPDINKSEVVWTVDRGALRVGLQDISFVGETAQNEIAKMKSTGSIKNFEDFLARRESGSAINKRVVKSLLYCGAFDEVGFGGSRLGKDSLFWLNDFDNFWEIQDKPKKLKEYYNNSNIAILPPEFFAEQRKELLKFNSESIDDGTTLRQIANITGMTVEQDEFEEFYLIGPDGQKFTRVEAETCQLPDTGLKIVHAVDGNIKPLKSENRTCNKCSLRNTCTAPVPISIGQLDLMIVGENPNWQDDKEGKPFVSDNFKHIWNILEDNGIDRESVNVCNTVSCMPQKGTKLTFDNVENCEWLGRYIRAIKPKFVASFGNLPMQFFSGRQKGVMGYNGKTEWSSKYNCWVTYIINPNMLFYHPEYISLLHSGISEYVRAILQFV